MYKSVPFETAHIKELMKEKRNAHLSSLFTDHFCEQLESSTSASVVDESGNVYLSIGIGDIWEGRGIVWTVFSEKAKSCFVSIFRILRKLLEEQQSRYRRIELSVTYGDSFEKASRRAKLLGFELETVRARAYLPGGEDCAIYSMVRG